MTRRVLIGAFPDGGYGLRISEPGYDVASNPVDNERLYFNSDWPEVLPIHQSGLIYVGANTTQTINFPNLGYTPFISSLVNIGRTASGGGRGWEQYSTCNAIKPIQRRNNTNTATYNTNQELVYTSDGGKYQNIRFAVFQNYMTVFCSNTDTAVYYFVYRLQAF